MRKTYYLLDLGLDGKIILEKFLNKFLGGCKLFDLAQGGTTGRLL
jgi:hypothetical protein